MMSLPSLPASISMPAPPVRGAASEPPVIVSAPAVERRLGSLAVGETDWFAAKLIVAPGAEDQHVVAGR